MKKLSEIGQRLSRHPVDGGLIPYDLTLQDKHTVCIFTPSELLEAYRIVWEAALSYVQSPDEAARPQYETFEDFIKEQGL